MLIKLSYVSVEIYNHTDIYKCIGIITHVFSTIFLLRKLISSGIPNQPISHRPIPPPKLIINLLLKGILFPIYVTNLPPSNPNSLNSSTSPTNRANNPLRVELSPPDLAMNSKTKINLWTNPNFRKDIPSMRRPSLINRPSRRTGHTAGNQVN